MNIKQGILWWCISLIPMLIIVAVFTPPGWVASLIGVTCGTVGMTYGLTRE